MDAKKVNIPPHISNEISEKYQLSNNTFKREVKSDPKDKIEIEIGDAKQDAFKPQLKIMRWDNEVNFSLRAEEKEGAVVETEGEVIKYVTADYEVHQYEKPEAGEDGGFEFEWVLPKKPKNNTLTSTIKTKGLNFFYQPALTEDEKKEGAIRPDNVVGSYAVYHSTKGGLNSALGMEYKTGKAFHIYRPEAIDAEGNKAWCELNIDVKSELLTVTVPQGFLDHAVYPVIVDPTFGYTSAGGSTSSSNDYIRGDLANPNSNGKIDSITACVVTANENIKSALYVGHTSYNSSISSLIAEMEEVNPGSIGTQWVTMNYTGNKPIVANTNNRRYFVCVWLDTMNLKYDSVQGGVYIYKSATYGSWLASMSISYGSNSQYSVYATYTEANIITDDITDSANDGFKYGVSGIITGGDVYLGDSTAGGKPECDAFFVFSPSIPSGSTIEEAYLELSGGTSGSGNPNLILSAAAADNPNAPTSGSEVNALVRTTANISWSEMSVGNASVVFSPDIKTCIQEVVDREGWASENNLIILVDNDDNTINNYETAKGAHASLIVRYTSDVVGVNSSTLTAVSPSIILSTNVQIEADTNTSTASVASPVTTAGSNVTTNADIQTSTITAPNPVVTTSTPQAVTVQANESSLTAPSPTILLASSVSITAGVQTSSVAIPTVSISGGATYIATALEITSQSITPTVEVTTSVTITPQAQTGSLTTPSPTVIFMGGYYGNTKMGLDINDFSLVMTGRTKIPTWTTSGRPTGRRGMLGWNREENRLEMYDMDAEGWYSINGTPI